VYKYLRHFKPLILFQATLDFFFRFLSCGVNGYIFTVRTEYGELTVERFNAVSGHNALQDLFL
jgi:hypothetical protein